MIVYSSTKSEFRDQVRNNAIEQIILDDFRRRLGHSTSKSEVESWKNSMQYMSNVLDDGGIPDDTGVAIEYRIPQTSKRIDFILTGRNEHDSDAVVIVELKQWSDAELTAKDGVVRTFVGGSAREVSHPSYQAWTYAALLRDFNETVQQRNIELRPCAYLHNMESGVVIRNLHYADHLEKAPAFIRSEAVRLTEFIKRHIRHGDRGRLMFEIENSRIRPSKNLADELVSMLKGNQEFLMIDDQKLVFETALELTRTATVTDKKVLIVEGGPGTGKSVVAINLLVALTGERLTTQYVTRNAAPRAVYESVLTGTFRKTHITNLFSGSGSYTECDANTFDALIVDEAHRLNERSGLYQNTGENQIREIIRAAKCAVFFLDEDQRVTWKDIGSATEIERWAARAGAAVHRMELQSQFRCNGSDGYVAWLDNVLQIRETANEDLEGIDFDFRVFDDPTEMMQLIEEKNAERNRARAVGGYCWDWITKKHERSQEYDIVMEEHGFRRRWNLDKDGSLWIRMPDSVHEIGCIHTCQGLEVDYIGVIIGPDLVIRDGRVVTQPENRSRMDSSIKGYKKTLAKDPEEARTRADRIIKNTYRTLMSRGQKGCYVYCTDSETGEYMKRQAQVIRQPLAASVGIHAREETMVSDRFPGLALRILASSEVRPFENCVPLYDMAVAAGGFAARDIEEYAWVELSAEFRPQPGMFVMQVVGDSMNRRIPNGAWCLFKLDPGGSREGKIVIVEHREIADPDTGGHYTVKRYHSRKADVGGSWRHRMIVLSPESFDGRYQEIVFAGAEAEELRVVGVFVAAIE